jgi:hypothetical protein
MKPTKKQKKIFAGILSIPIVIIFFFIGPIGWGLLIISTIVLISILPNKKNRFIQLQASLPTSKIRSIAMGLVEIEGALVMQEPLLSPIDNKPCIGYHYLIKKTTRDKDGDEHSQTLFEKKECNNFLVEDETGRIKVIAEGLEWVWIPETLSRTIDGKEHIQYLLTEGDKVLIVGNADSIGGDAIITRHQVKKVFGIAPIGSVSKWNRYKPLLNAFLLYFCIALIFIVVILLSDIKILDNRINFNILNR